MDNKYVPSTTFIAFLAIAAMMVWQMNVTQALAMGGAGGGNHEPVTSGSTHTNSTVGIKNTNLGAPCTGNCITSGFNNVGGGGGGGGATDSHGQVNGGGTGSVNGGTTAGGPR